MRVDDKTFNWLGAPAAGIANATVLTGRAITPTKTVITVQAGGMEANITFLSPIEVRLLFCLLTFLFMQSPSSRRI
jgi:hypothetical protein